MPDYRIPFSIAFLLAPLGCAKLNEDRIPPTDAAAEAAVNDATTGNDAAGPEAAADVSTTPADASDASEAGGDASEDAGPWSGQAAMTAVAWGKDHIELLARGSEGDTHHREFVTHAWGEWEDIGGPVYGAPAAIAWSPSDSHVDVFLLGTGANLFNKSWFLDGTLGWIWYPSGAGWLSQGTPPVPAPPIASGPALASFGDGFEDVFVTLTDHTVWTRSWASPTTQWGDWVQLGGATIGSVAAVAAEPSTLELFGLGTDGNVYWISGSSNTWASNPSWLPLGGATLGIPLPPVAVSWGTGRIDLFVLGQDGAVYTRSTSDGMTWDADASPTAWSSLGGSPAATFVGPLSAVASAPGRIDVFLEASDRQIYTKAFTASSWGTWSAIGGGVSSAPIAVTGGPDVIDLFVVWNDRSIMTKAFDGTTWSPADGWSSLGGQVAF